METKSMNTLLSSPLVMLFIILAIVPGLAYPETYRAQRMVVGNYFHSTRKPARHLASSFCQMACHRREKLAMYLVRVSFTNRLPLCVPLGFPMRNERLRGSH